MEYSENDRKILFFYEEIQRNIYGELVLNICRIDKPYSEHDRNLVFSAVEAEYYAGKKTEKGKREYFFSRVLAKQAVNQLYKDKKPLNEIIVAKGHFNNPIIKGKDISCQIGISHCDNYASAIAYPDEMMLGLDMEQVSVRNAETIYRILTEREKKLFPLDMEQNTTVCMMWTAKEALVKLLKVGLTVDFDILQIDSFQKSDGGVKMQFRSFSTITAYSFLLDDLVCTIAYMNRLHVRQAGCFQEAV